MVNYSRPGVTGKMIEESVNRRSAIAYAESWKSGQELGGYNTPQAVEVYSVLDRLHEYPAEHDPQWVAALAYIMSLVEALPDEAKQERKRLLQWREERRLSLEPRATDPDRPAPAT